MQDCLLIWDSDAQMYKLEKMEGFAQMRYTRKQSKPRGSFTDGGGSASTPVEPATPPKASTPAPTASDISSKSSAVDKPPARKRKTEMLPSAAEATKKTKRSGSESRAPAKAAKDSKAADAKGKAAPVKGKAKVVRSSKASKKEAEGSDMEDLLADLDEIEEDSSQQPATQPMATQGSASSPADVVDDFDEDGDDVVDQFSDEDNETKQPPPAAVSGPVDMFGQPSKPNSNFVVEVSSTLCFC
jgi:hypothetical protein